MNKKNRILLVATFSLLGASAFLALNSRSENAPELRKRLTPLQYKVTQENGTEPAFQNEYWDETREGLYVDLIDGTPLFSSKDKFKSGTGWPSFTQPISNTEIVEKADYKFGILRTEVRSLRADSHLGHVFPDGPPPTGLRYCINSAALRFIPVTELESEGYGEYQNLFLDSSPSLNKDPMLQTATFAGGCFWCMEPPFEKLEGVLRVVSGYAGGPELHPSYQQVASGKTGHAEVVQITYDPNQISYEELLSVFWRNIDPTQIDGQFVDRGRQYRTAIFTQNERQAEIARTSRDQMADSGRFKDPIVTEITPLDKFYPAEDYHQDYYKKNPLRYKYYRHHSGRDQYLEKIWGADRE